MFDLSIDYVALSFGVFNVLRLISYFPQIIAVARDDNGATAISFSCWSIWIGANASTTLYAWVKVGDVALALMNGFNAACCAVVLVLAVYKRAMIRGRRAPPAAWCHWRTSHQHGLASSLASAMLRETIPRKGPLQQHICGRNRARE